MPDRPSPAHLAAALALLAVAALVGARLGSGPEAPRVGAAPIEVESASAGRRDGGRIVVHVAGAVRRPGVYRLPAGARVQDAVLRAGGAGPRADLTTVNLAGELEDGRQVVVPERAATAAGPGVATAAGSATAATGGSPAGTAAAATGPPINLNAATLEQLDALDGIGPTTAQKILDWRTEHGGFGSVEELAQIPGIGEVRMATLRERVTV